MSQISSAAVIPEKGPATEPLPPSQDPWYRAPPGFESKRPGDVLRVRSAPGNLTQVVGDSLAAYNILYRTTDSRDRPSWAVTTLFIPPSIYFSPSGKAALVSYQFAYNTANLDSSPSIGLYWRLAQSDPNLGLRSDTSLIDEMLRRGWIVNTPDHLGPTVAFGASVQAGHATLDSIRAVHSLSGSLIKVKDVNTALWGYSGGTIASLAAAELHPHYDPGLKLDGIAIGGLVDDLSADFDNLNETPIASTLVAFLLGITAQYPDARRYLESRLVPETKDDFLSVLNINAADASTMFAGKDIYPYLKGGVADMRAPILRRLYDRQTKLGNKAIPTMPMFVYKAIGDEYCPVEQTDATVKRFCSAGAHVTYERNTVGDHVSEIENGNPAATRWLWSIFDESYKPPASGCTVRNVTVEVPV